MAEGNTTGDFVEGYFDAVDRRYQEMVDHGDEDDEDYDDMEGYEDNQWCSACFSPTPFSFLVLESGRC